MPVSDETKDFLDQVKKGKTRKFVMLTKGTSVVSLVLFKKGAATKFIKEAKESGKGIPCFGVIEGGGMDVTLKLATADGFKDAPVKDLVLKKFLEDEADFKCKPTIEIVEALPIVLDEADPLVARFLKLQVLAKQAAAKNPAGANAINTLCRQIGGYLDADQREQATSKLEDLEAAIGDASSSDSAAGGAASSAKPDAEREAFDAARKKLEPLLLAVTKAVPDKATALMGVWNYAEAQAAAGNLPNANKALANLTEALKKAAAEAPKSDASRFGIPENIVQDRKRFLAARWQQAMDGVRGELAKLRQAIARELPGVDAAAVTDGVEKGLSEFFRELSDAVAGTSAATGANARPLDDALVVVRRYKQLATNNESIRLLNEAKSELGVSVDVETTLRDALNELELKLAG